jgi:hypothetical protein
MRLVVALALVLSTVPYSILLLKAKGWLCLVALAIPVGGLAIAVAGAARLAKPHSWWAREVYRDEQARRARQRYPDAPTRPATVLATLGWMMLVLYVVLAALYALDVVPT